MGRRSTLVVAVACVIVAGCSSGIPGQDTRPMPTPTVETRPTPTSTQDNCRDVVPREMPDPPVNLTRQSATSYTSSYTNVSYWNDQFAGHEYIRVDIDTDGFVINQTETGYLVHVGRQVSTLDCEGTHGDPARYGFGYDYFINESVLAMNYTGVGVENATVHPHVTVGELLQNGRIVEQWNQTG